MRRLWLFLCCLSLAATPADVRRIRVRVPVWTAAEGSLDPQTLKATVLGTPARVVAVRRPEDDLMVLLVLDLTDSLTLAETAKEAVIAEIQRLPSNAYVGLLRAQDGMKVLLDPTADRAAVADAIRSAPISGKAGLLDTIELGERLADSILLKSAVRLAVLYVTDSDIRNYREDFSNPVVNASDSGDLSRRFPEQIVQERISRLEATLSSGQAPLFVVHLSWRSDRLNEAYQNGIKRLTEATSGTSIICRSNAEIPGAIKRAWELIATHYSVTLEVPAATPRNLEIQLNCPSGNLSYRTRLVLGKE